ncbi:hypothetical protein QVD17_37920 [Tagetes erecta]|uniref:Aminotransferase-like plant mobile domain-containing protein n=1 Tax=Tagetes erecta TaxID=13708 RepID=A0AAD8JZ92_TARER|nr:hypothetical protein QVD17_37920 [Tagetes erecta]
MVRGDLTFWVEVFGKAIEFDERVTKYVDLAGFGGILRCGYRKFNHALIEALIERWRPETNTSHLPFGEVTMTLQDVNVLWGLPIEGDALLGIKTSYDVKERKHLVKTFLDSECQQRACCICLILASKTLLSDKNNANVSLHFLRHLEDMTKSGGLSWDSSTIACLYRELTRGTHPNAETVSGPMSLLQIWAWTQIIPLAPTV